MKEIPILFSTPMVRAILEGRKTQTRRIIKPQPIIDQDSGFVFDGKHTKQYSIHNWKDQFIDDFSRWMPEDLLWVRESGWVDNNFQRGLNDPHLFWKADYSDYTDDTKYVINEHTCPFPSIHMYKEFARIWIQVNDIKVEKLQDISEDDAKAEGFACLSKDGGTTYKYGIPDNDGLPGVDNLGWPWQDWEVDPKNAVKTLWSKINGEESWNENPFVWVVSFNVLSTSGKPTQLSPGKLTANP